MRDTPLSAVLAAIEQIVSRLDRREAGQARVRVELTQRMDRLQDGFMDWANVEHAERIGAENQEDN